jgi:hypothetical protein
MYISLATRFACEFIRQGSNDPDAIADDALEIAQAIVDRVVELDVTETEDEDSEAA